MKQLIPLLLTFLIFSCAGSESNDDNSDNSNKENNQTSEEVEETDDENNLADGLHYTAWAAVDGPDESLWIASPEEYKNEGEADIPDFDVLDVVPEQQYNERDEICTWMLGMIVNDFGFWGAFDDFTGKVNVHYDGNQNYLASQYNVVNGKPDGLVKVWDPRDNLYLKWEYKEGKWIGSELSPYGANWTFQQAKSKLRVMDEDNAISYDGGTKVVKLMKTFRYHMDDQNTLYKIMEKESFNNPFLINGEVFTGRLEAYWMKASTEGQLYYELNFQNGWLDGDVKIYNDWGEMELHEVFAMGELDTTLYKLDYSQMDGVAKPIIYFYPERDMRVNVDLHFDGELTHTYPKYNKGWQVLAKTDGTLIDEYGKEYYALYWEGNAREAFTMDEGFVVPGEETTEFLEKSLDILGLNRREANEFIVYWLPKLENNPYNLIHFSTKEYDKMAKLNISPQPETLIRVMMVYKPLDATIDIPVQDLNKISKTRKGFTVVEWGGSLYEEKVLP